MRLLIFVKLLTPWSPPLNRPRFGSTGYADEVFSSEVSGEIKQVILVQLLTIHQKRLWNGNVK